MRGNRVYNSKIFISFFTGTHLCYYRAFRISDDYVMIVRQTEPPTPELIPILIPVIYALYSSQRLVNLAG